jgi:hypothetical protein
MRNEVAAAPERTKRSRFKGVVPQNGRWRAYADANDRRVHLGTFGFEVDAAIARNYFDAYHGKPLSNAIPADECHHD